MKRYNPTEIEKKWQDIWESDNRYQAKNSANDKFYISCMFPYPSGAGMHAGHAFEHAIVDAVARFWRAHGKEVLNPMGWDSFGLPAENYAIKTGTAPSVSTKQNIANFTRQLKRMGASIDWSREINTSDPEYYRWTQWIFTKLFEKGLAYQKTANQWWCPVDKTVLANEQVENGRCWRCDSEVFKKPMKQWFFKITDYADSLLAELPDLNWPEKIKTAQENWIGRSEGAEIDFEVVGMNDKIKVFSTRPDTIFGATFIVLAPENEIISSLTNDKTRETVDSYIAESLKKSEVERMSEGRDKTGVFTGSYVINPASGEKIPIWVADYVLGGYGTGAVMAVPAHDERDFEFAEKFDLPIVEVVERPENSKESLPYSGEGVLVNSGSFNGKKSSDIREDLMRWMEEGGIGKPKTTYKMRDWLVSRQRYWGAPIPIIHCEDHGAVVVPENQLPVLLPEVENYAPTGEGSVLSTQESWVNVECPTCGKPAKRETDTMDGYACSSWYLLRYTDPHNNQKAWDSDIVNHWAPLDMYVGGDHAVAHLLYVRFWTHVFNDMGLVDFKEPVSRLVYHGYINAEDGTKMSKSKGNVVDPLEVIDQGYGADTLRTFELFLGPIDENSNWSSTGIGGVYRFLNRVWTLVDEFLQIEDLPTGDSEELAKIQNITIKKVTNDIRRLSFNTAIAALMEYTNQLYKLKTNGFTSQWRQPLEDLIQMIAPFAPHMAAEMWQSMGNGDNLDKTPWPKWDESKMQTSTMTVIVQVNGKLRAKLQVAAEASKEEIEAMALADEHVKSFIGDGGVKKIIYVPGKLVNIVA